MIVTKEASVKLDEVREWFPDAMFHEDGMAASVQAACPINKNHSVNIPLVSWPSPDAITCSDACPGTAVWRAASAIARSHEPGNPEGWAIRSHDEFQKHKFPPVVWLIQDLVPSDSVTYLFAAPNVGKTLEAMDVAYQVAAAGKKVLYIQAEGPGARGQRRAQRAQEFRGGEVHHLFRPLGFSILNPLHVSWLIEQVRLCAFDFVVFDSLSALADGDENEQARAIAEAFNYVKDITHAALFVLHHTTKEAWQPGRKPTLKDSRGPGVLLARADAALALVPAEEVAGVVRFHLWVLKQRDDEKVGPREVEVLMTGDSAVVTMKPLEPKAKAETPIEALLLAALPTSGKGWSIDYARKHLGKRWGDVNEAMQRLARDKKVRLETRGGWLNSSHSSQAFPDDPDETSPNSSHSSGVFRPEEGRSAEELFGGTK